MGIRLLLLVLTLAASGFVLEADTVTVNPGQFAQYTFVSNAPTFGCPPSATASTCDTLIVLVPFVSAPGNVTADLFNGSTLLGSFSGICCAIAFKSASSVYGSGSVVDFTSIQNGTIDGIVDVSSTQPFTFSTDTDLYPGYSNIYLGNATSAASTSESSYSATVTGVAVVPEPAQDAGITMLAFLACVGLRRFALQR
jgi:hypothetical protein